MPFQSVIIKLNRSKKAESMAKLIISTLGALQITNGANPIAGFLSDKVRALLIYLAVEQTRPFRREALAALFWPEQPESKARANLRRALANLRRVIDDGHEHHLLITRQSLQFNGASSAGIDIIQFETLLSGNKPGLAQMEEAVALVNGRFLAGFSIHGSIAFEEWALLKREQIQRQFLRSLNLLTTHYEDRRRLHKALRFAWQQVNVEPWYEPGQRQLMRLLAQTKQRTAALTHYEQFREELARELGLSPEPATRRLYEKIREDRPVSAIDQNTPTFLAVPHTLETTPFVGRELELAQLNTYLPAGAGARASVVFITGEAGSGKTALLQTFAQRAQETLPELIPLFGECRAHIGQGSPYLPFQMILARAAGDIESQWQNGTLNRQQVTRLWSLRRTAVQLLQEEAPDVLANLVDPALLEEAIPPTAVSQSPAKEPLFQQMTRFLQKFSQHGPLLLLLDDLHWVDQGTVDLLFHLRRPLCGYPILIVGTYRPEELLTDQPEVGRRHPLSSYLHELGRDYGEIEVSLNRADGWSFVNAVLDSEPNCLEESFRELLYKRTQGHALFTVELLAGMKDRGELVPDKHGFWQPAETISWQQLPAKIEAIISQRIGRLPQSKRHILNAGAVQGDTFAVEIVAELLNRHPHELVQTISSDLVRSHRLIQSQGRQQIGAKAISMVRFRHNIFQQYIYQRLDPIERAYLHLLTAEKLEHFYETAEIDLPAVAAQLAYHFTEAEEVIKAGHYHQLAGQHSLRLSAHADAAAHFQKSVDLLDGLPEKTERNYQEIECLLALGAALLALQGYAAPEVKQVYDRAYNLCLKVDAKPEMVSSLFWLSSYYATSGRLQEGLVMARQMLAVTSGEEIDDLTKILAHVLNGLPLFFMGCNEEALTHFEHACALYDPEQHQPHVYTLGQDPGITAMIWRGHTLVHLGRMAAAQRCLQQALDWAEALDHPYTSSFTQLNAGCTPQIYFGRFAEGVKFAEASISIAQENDFALIYAYGIYFLGQMLVLDNVNGSNNEAKVKVDEGIDLMYQGMEMEAKTGSRLGLSSRWVVFASLYLQLGQTELAWQAVHTAEREINERDERHFEAEFLRVKGELFLLKGDTRQAEGYHRQAIQIARQQKALFWEKKLTNGL